MVERERTINAPIPGMFKNFKMIATKAIEARVFSVLILF